MSAPEPREEDVRRVWVRGLCRLVLCDGGRLYYWPLNGKPHPALRLRLKVAEAERIAKENGFTWLARVHQSV